MIGFVDADKTIKAADIDGRRACNSFEIQRLRLSRELLQAVIEADKHTSSASVGGALTRAMERGLLR